MKLINMNATFQFCNYSLFTLLLLVMFISSCKKECDENWDDATGIDAIIRFETIVDSLIADGETQSPIKVAIYPCADVTITEVEFSTLYGAFVNDSGTNTKTIKDDLNGENIAQAIYVPPLSEDVDLNNIISAKISYTNEKTVYELEHNILLKNYEKPEKAYAISFINGTQSVLGNNTDLAALTVEVNTEENVDGDSIFFNTNLGTFENSPYGILTNKTATVYLKHNQTGIANVTAAYKDSIISAVVTFTDEEVAPYSLTFINSAQTVVANNSDLATLTIDINTTENIDGEEVVFSTNLGSFLNGGMATVSNKTATVFLKSNQDGVANVTAGYKDSTISTVVTFTEELTIDTLYNLTINSLTPNSILANNNQLATLELELVSPNGGTVDGKMITLSSTLPGVTISPSTVVISQGTGTATIKSSTEGNALITASHGYSGISSAIENIAFTRVYPDYITIQTSPSSTIVIDSTSSNSTDVTFTATPGLIVGDFSSGHIVNWDYTTTANIPLGEEPIFSTNNCLASAGGDCQTILVNPFDILGNFQVRAYVLNATNDTVTVGTSNIVYIP